MWFPWCCMRLPGCAKATTVYRPRAPRREVCWRSASSLSEHSAAMLYAPFAVLLWTSVRFGVSGSCASVLILGILAIVGMLNQTGPFVAPGPYQSAISLLLFLVLTSMTMLLLCSALEERSALERTDAASR